MTAIRCLVLIVLADTMEPMRAHLIIGVMTCAACSSLFAATNEPVYLGIDAKGVRHESKESAGNAPWMRDLAYSRGPSPLPGDRTRWYEGVGIFRLRIDPTSGATREITIVRSAGIAAFDRSALQALKLWRFKPQTWTQVDVPMLFQRGGGVLFFPRYTTLPARR
jgi:TonB family protein